ncbi:hypothetical protein Mal15_15730 [Stieleria maiorica]|uniref:Uncharacterized protein n=1 Tax=Stieleria maiorica TaxID=2795974 RepID=A0A5B9MA22_9BACT|nr:hypothetical protein [Stieleria maiorica]QEF97533.1 hypothetical protein Mal15_15730 [Stieleria maiorica]
MKSNLKNGLLGTACAAMALVLLADNAPAQFPLPEIAKPDAVVAKPTTDDADVVAAPHLIDAIPSSSDLSTGPRTAAEIRQARAQYRSQQRMERMERNLWAGYEPLRPNWNSIPMMSSRYPYRHTVVVPLYVYPR